MVALPSVRSPWLVFLLAWAIFGFFNTTDNQRAYTLQQAGVEALADRGTFDLNGSPTPAFQSVGDTFGYRGHLYAAKQPGQFVLGVPAYKILNLFGLNYRTNYDLTASLVTWMTSGLLAALMTAIVFLFTSRFTRNLAHRLLVTGCFALGTLILPYAGVLHHDILGGAIALAAWWFVYRDKPWAGGLLVGLAVFFSLLATFTALGVGVFALVSLRPRRLVPFCLAALAGLVPTLVFNAMLFGNPLTPPNVAGAFQDTFPRFGWDNLAQKLDFYFLSGKTGILAFSPVLLLSIPGIFLFPRGEWRLKLFLGVQLVFVLGYLFTMQTVGDAQYGPRYLLTTLPFLSMALTGWFSGSRPRIHKAAFCLMGFLGGVSAVICAVGALQTTMQGDLSVWPFSRDFALATAGQFPPRLLVMPSVILMLIVGGLGAWKVRQTWGPGLGRLATRLSETAVRALKDPRFTPWALASILLLATLLRVWDLGANPNGFYCDEASIGYNAYSISETGQDEWGTPMPLYFQAFGEYKNPVYIYAAVPMIRLFGLTVFGVRMTSVVFGVLTVLFTFLLGRKWFGKGAGLAAALFLTLSPWHIQFSRVAFEAISMPCFVTAGLYLLVKALEKPRWAYAAAVVLALTPYTYAPVKPFLAVMLLLFAVLYRKELWARRWDYLPALVLFILLEIPLVEATFWGPVQARFNTLFIGNGRTFPEAALLFVQNYLAHWSPRFLFQSGDGNGRHSWQGSGEFYVFEVLLGLTGLVILFFRNKRVFGLMAAWLVLFPLAASLTTEGIPHAIRTLYVLPAFQVLGASALIEGFRWWRNPGRGQAPKVAGGLLAILCLGSTGVQVSYFVGHYWTDYPRNFLWDWDYGLKEVVQEAQTRTDLTRIYVPSNYQPVSVLFFTQYPPRLWQQSHTMPRFAFQDPSASPGLGKEAAIVPAAPGIPGPDVLYRVDTPRGEPYLDLEAMKPRVFETAVLPALAPSRTGGLGGSYYLGTDFRTLQFSRVDPGIQFDWSDRPPDPRMPKENYSVHWKGWVKADRDGPVTFALTSDDGSRLFIGDRLVIDQFTPHPATRVESEVVLQKGWNPVELDYFQDGGKASASLNWKTASGTWEPVPSDHLGHG